MNRKLRVLLEDVDDFQVEFFVAPGKDPTESESWEESYTGTELPFAIAIVLTTKDFGEIRREFLLSRGASNATGT